MKRTINSIVTEAIVKYRVVQDEFNAGEIDRPVFDRVVQGVYEVCVEAFDNLRACPSEHTFQKVRVINIASGIILKMEGRY